jgi:ferredoxin
MHLGPAVSGRQDVQDRGEEAGRTEVHDRGGVEGRLVVDRVRCDGIGICAFVASRVVDLDDWGYPLVPDGVLRRADARAARAAVRACPRRALTLLEPVEPADQASGAPPVTPRTWDVT